MKFFKINNNSNNKTDDDTYDDKIRDKICDINIIFSRLGNIVTNNKEFLKWQN